MAVDIPTSVVRKLMFFTVAMVALPLVVFFMCQYLFDNSIVSGGSAAVAANAVLIAYIVAAFSEDTSQEAVESKKDQ
ncbi:putative LYR motif-containing protein [Clavispora lusitaniae]|uniref:Vacuolar ATPase assembly integral membrane protein n=2 Tax=Clavispora lusitaniae TaxID=36911 RepID=A0AA91T0W8_CLALS|nr:putative vacuolar ATPase assembly integral membrane protein [Clavispora lusitaniae]QFZ27193.1 putative LYR motif-containing protein [Clavispora lusitaniae]QFZ33499.1 putative LYR motif-containing protein [Clavispora lusitaniae]QFZ39170.1 putative LYR motif-containing protein [Clavispora lusitaniae]QFZ44852.1 putative LYR motif-containing protein [Clavispora lusitaniae]